MLRQRTRTLQAAIAVTDAAATIAAFFAVYYGLGDLPQRWGFKEVLPITRYFWLLAVAVPLWWALFGLFGCYDLSPIERVRDSLRRMAPPLIVGALAVGAVVFFSKELLFARRVVGGFVIGNIACLVLGRLLMLKTAPRLYRETGARRRVVILGLGPAAREFGAAVQRAGWGLELAGYVAPGRASADADCLGAAADLPRILDERSIDDVVLAEPGIEWSAVQAVIHACEEVGAILHISSKFFAAQISRPHLEQFSGICMLTFTSAPYSPISLGIKRAADLLASLILGLGFALPMLGIALLVKLTSRGPVLFKQRRSGLYGRDFDMYKFRSMVADAEAHRAELEGSNEMAGPVFKMRHDPRITPLGRVLRKYSLDELPQLWNVFKGEMSLIGPRPPLPSEVARYARWQRRRLSMRPGLTCIWQVTDRNRASFDQWMEYDLQYIDNWSLWLDLRIAAKTIPAILKGTGL